MARFPTIFEQCPHIGSEYSNLGIIRRQLQSTQIQLQTIPEVTSQQVLNQQEQYAKMYRSLDNLQKILPVLATIKISTPNAT